MALPKCDSCSAKVAHGFATSDWVDLLSFMDSFLLPTDHIEHAAQEVCLCAIIKFNFRLKFGIKSKSFGIVLEMS